MINNPNNFIYNTTFLLKVDKLKKRIFKYISQYSMKSSKTVLSYTLF